MSTASEPSYQVLVQENARLRAQVLYLQQELAQLRRLIFGTKRERFIPGNLTGQRAFEFMQELTGQDNVPPRVQTVQYTRRQGSGKSSSSPHPVRHPLPSHLPREEVVIEPEEDVSGMKRIGEEVTEELDYRPGKLYVRRIVRPRYARVDGNGVVIGKMPSRVIEKGIAGAGLLAHVLISKYVDHLPLYRQRQQFRREGVELAESTLVDWVRRSGELLEPLYDLIGERVLSSGYIMADETPLRVLDRGRKGGSYLGYYWLYYSPLDRLVYFDFRSGRSRAGPEEFLRDYRGYLQTDGYRGYASVLQRSEVVGVGCMAHARRYFVRAREQERADSDWLLERVQRLYGIERVARESGLSHEERGKMRQRESAPILEEIHQWLKAQANELLPRSLFGKAVKYMLSNWPRLVRYADDGKLEIDNNLVENAVRPVALGRKNYLFAGSREGARRGAIIYTLVGTARLHGVEPFTYLRDVLSRIADHPYKKIDELLPNNWKR
jgi:transposase